MEFALVTGLAILGRHLSGNRKQDAALPEQSQRTHEKFKCAPKQNVPTPFFRKASSQNTNTSLMERKCDAFTGSDTISWQPKKEIQNLFEPTKSEGNIYGAPATFSSTLDRYNVNNMPMNNVSPIEKQYVGPGLNTDAAATGGFHDHLRIMPKNVSVHNKNQNVGSVVAGKAMNSSRSSAPDSVRSTSKERYYTMDQRPVAPSMASVTAASTRSALEMRGTSRSCETNYTGAVGNTNTHGSMQYSASQTREHDRTMQGVVCNGHQQGIGSRYTKSKFIIPLGERENAGQVLNANSSKLGGHVANKRELDPTFRDNKTKHVIGPSSYISGGTNRTYDAGETHRDTKVEYSAPAISAHKAVTNHHAHRNIELAGKRDESSRPFAPSGGRMNLRETPDNVIGHSELRTVSHKNIVQHGTGPTAGVGVSSLGNVEYDAQLPSHNTRNDFSIASDQLSHNPYSHNFTTT